MYPACTLIPIFTIEANIARRRVKCKGYTERALYLYFSGSPALTFYPVRAACCLSGKYGLVCSCGKRALLQEHI